MNGIITRWFNVLFILIAAFPLLGMRVTSYIIGVWGVIALTLSIKEKTYTHFFIDRKVILILTSYYLLNIVSFLLLGDNTITAFKLLETKALFILFPILIYLSNSFFYRGIIKFVTLSFAVSNVLLAIYVWIHILDIGLLKLFKTDTYYNPIIRNTFSDLTAIHLPYLGMLFSFSCIIFIDWLSKKGTKSFFLKIASILSIFFLLFSIMIFSARMAFFALTIAVIYYFLKKISKKRIIFLFIGFLGITFLVSLLNPIQRRIKEISKISFTIPKENMKSHEVNFRLVIYDSSLEILKTHWLFGVGLGNTQDTLDESYKKINYENYDDFSKKTYNTHNQYLNEWITHGVFGFIIFIVPLVFFLINGSELHRTFLVLVYSCLITENLFHREIGVIFFTLFNTFFYILEARTERK
jgi:O-antigen ligase